MNTIDNEHQNISNNFEKNGYCIVKGLFDINTIDNATEWLRNQNPSELAKSWTEQEPGVPIAVYSVVHDDQNPVSKLITNQSILKISNILMKKPCYLWSSKVNLKAAWCGTAEYYHQDFAYWKDRGYLVDEMLSCMVFLEKHNINNAALHVIPGSHKNKYIEHIPFININGLSKRMVPPKILNSLYVQNGIDIIEAERGDALFFHASLVHGSGHNISPFGRMILLAQINTIGNEPIDVMNNSRNFNLQRAKEEIIEAQRKLDYFKEKYEKQINTADLTFCPPIPNHES